MIDLGGFQFEMTLKATTNTKVVFFFVFFYQSDSSLFNITYIEQPPSKQQQCNMGWSHQTAISGLT